MPQILHLAPAPSIATTDRPANLTDPPGWVGAGPASSMNSSRNGLGPTRRIACVIEDFAGRGTSVRSPPVNRDHTYCHPCSANNAPERRRIDHHARGQPSQPFLATAGCFQRCIDHFRWHAPGQLAEVTGSECAA